MKFFAVMLSLTVFAFTLTSGTLTTKAVREKRGDNNSQKEDKQKTGKSSTSTDIVSLMSGKTRGFVNYIPGSTGDPEIYLPFNKVATCKINGNINECINDIINNVKDPKNRRLKLSVKYTVANNIPNGRIQFTVSEGSTVLDVVYKTAQLCSKGLPFLIKYNKEEIVIQYGN